MAARRLNRPSDSFVVAVIAEPRPDPRITALAPAPVIELPPVDVVPDSVRPAIERYAVDTGASSRSELITAVDQAGHPWEHAIATRAVAARAELVDACRQVSALHDELVQLEAAGDGSASSRGARAGTSSPTTCTWAARR